MSMKVDAPLGVHRSPRVIEEPKRGVAALYSVLPFGQIAPAQRVERRRYA